MFKDSISFVERLIEFIKGLIAIKNGFKVNLGFERNQSLGVKLQFLSIEV